MKKLLILAVLLFATQANAAPIQVNSPSATISLSTSSACVNVPSGSFTTVRIYHTAADVVYFAAGGASTTAAAGTTYVAPGAIEVFTLPANATKACGIATSGTGTAYLQFSTGE